MVMNKQPNNDLAAWMEISAAMLRDLLPRGAGIEAFGHGLPPEEFAALVDAESARVEHALVALATAADGEAVRVLFGQLSPATVMVLFSRWAHYTEAWKKRFNQPSPQHWVPPRDCWRAVFLAMTGENWYSTEAARQLWPEAF